MVNWKLLLNQNACLEFDVEENGWAQVSLSQDGRNLSLGAENFKIISERLLGAFQDFTKRESVGAIDGLSVVWVFSLAEKHTSVYLGKENGSSILFLQDANGNASAKVKIESTAVNLLETTPKTAAPSLWLRG